MGKPAHRLDSPSHRPFWALVTVSAVGLSVAAGALAVTPPDSPPQILERASAPITAPSPEPDGTVAEDVTDPTSLPEETVISLPVTPPSSARPDAAVTPKRSSSTPPAVSTPTAVSVPPSTARSASPAPQPAPAVEPVTAAPAPVVEAEPEVHDCPPGYSLAEDYSCVPEDFWDEPAPVVTPPVVTVPAPVVVDEPCETEWANNCEYGDPDDFHPEDHPDIIYQPTPEPTDPPEGSDLIEESP